MEYEKWFGCEDVNIFFLFFVDYVKFGVLFWFLLKLFSNIRIFEFMSVSFL